jgi:hypothetical protein
MYYSCILIVLNLVISYGNRTTYSCTYVYTAVEVKLIFKKSETIYIQLYMYPAIHSFMRYILYTTKLLN